MRKLSYINNFQRQDTATRSTEPLLPVIVGQVQIRKYLALETGPEVYGLRVRC